MDRLSSRSFNGDFMPVHPGAPISSVVNCYAPESLPVFKWSWLVEFGVTTEVAVPFAGIKRYGFDCRHDNSICKANPIRPTEFAR